MSEREKIWTDGPFVVTLGLLSVSLVFIYLISEKQEAVQAIVDNRRNTLEKRERLLATREDLIEEKAVDLAQRKEKMQVRSGQVDERAVSMVEGAEVLKGFGLSSFTNTPKTAPRIWLDGWIEYHKGNFLSAKMLYESSLAIEDEYAPALTSLGRVTADLTGQPGIVVYATSDSESEAYFLRALDADSKYPPALVYLGYASLWRGDYESALELANKTLAARPGYRVARRLKSSVASKREKVE